jgi:murein L,D-transpeptidase YcbB/YkuD
MKKYLFKFALICVVTAFSSASCGQPAPDKAKAARVLTNTKIMTGSFDSLQIGVFFRKYPLLTNSHKEVLDFYRKRNFEYAWFYNSILVEQAGNLATRVLNFKSDGLGGSSPYQYVLDSLLNQSKLNGGGVKPHLELEIMLTAQYFKFSKAAYQGIDVAASRASGWLLPRKKVIYGQYLDSILKTPDDHISIKEPVYRQYELLRSFLKKYSRLQAEDPWLPLTPAKRIVPGDTSSIIRLLRIRLYKLGDFRGDTLTNQYDKQLQQGVKVFQDRHGLAINGLLNKETLAELNVPLAARIKQILVNMERSRWLPVNLNSDYVAVNIPEYKMHVYHADSLLWSCSVVVGQTKHPTTAFYGEIQYVVFSPYWNVPPGILANEIVPGIKRNGNYLRDHHMEIDRYRNGLPVVRQRPGNNNSLGLVKFLFPNSYNIYLHDTPSKSLFGETSRAFSHGCIRIAEPAKLAAFLLKYDPNWTDAKISKSMHAGRERYVTLKDKVPVFIAYLTAFADRNGHLNFRKDIYDLDKRLAQLLTETDKN